jgi:hypothetical protein
VEEDDGVVIDVQKYVVYGIFFRMNLKLVVDVRLVFIETPPVTPNLGTLSILGVGLVM